MRVYLALGDSISIDDYTGVSGGGAASQLARMASLELIDLTRDGNTTDGVLADLARAPGAADIVTITAGGNDLLRRRRAAYDPGPASRDRTKDPAARSTRRDQHHLRPERR
jgi:lysophospholipase L1-like esterase